MPSRCVADLLNIFYNLFICRVFRQFDGCQRFDVTSVSYDRIACFLCCLSVVFFELLCQSFEIFVELLHLLCQQPVLFIIV